MRMILATVALALLGAPALAEPPNCAKKSWANVLDALYTTDGIQVVIADGAEAKKWLDVFNALIGEGEVEANRVAVGIGPGGIVIYTKDGACLGYWSAVGTDGKESVLKSVYGSPA